MSVIMDDLQEILKRLRQAQFDSAIPLVVDALRSAAAESPQKLDGVARNLLRFQGFFRNTAEAIASETYFRTVHDVLAELTGRESPLTMTAAENLGALLGSVGKVEEAIALREKVLAYMVGRFPSDDTRVSIVRNGLGVLYQRAGVEDKLKDLYKDTGLCEHLRPAEAYIRQHGGRVISSGQPWSANCHLWVYFDMVLDCDRLIHDLALASCVQIHDHRGTHDGSERGIVCTIHNDGIMGPHPGS
jgi:hypothetical protein